MFKKIICNQIYVKKNYMQSNNATDLIWLYIYIFEIIWDYIIVIILTKHKLTFYIITLLTLFTLYYR